MGRLRYFIVAMRLRTLPLSVSGVSLGLMLAASDYHIDWGVAVLALLTAVFLQILSNVSNELGDSLRGTDREDRQGPEYAISRGYLTVKDFKAMIWVYVLLCILSGLALIRCSFGTLLSLESLMLMMLGAVAISGAMRYTLGRNPYGYRGFGDFSVFLFFGIVAVLGSYFVAAHEICSWIMLLPAVSIGCFSVCVLNVNNMRDMKSDIRTRVTIPIKIGEKNARIYHTVLIIIGWASMILYASLRMYDPWHYLFFLALPLFVVHLAGVWRLSGKDLDRMLPLLTAASLLFALTAGAGFLVYLI